ncbi:MAG: PAS domain S-box protein, partial [Desulfobacterota bacterium]|nr:PAS domain S-box protein [Thermodesulfobacteriota bacterium]
LPFLEVLDLLNADSRAFVYLHDQEGRFYYLSTGVTRVTGYSPEEWEVHYSTYLTDNPLNRQVHEHTRLALESGCKQPPYEAEIRHRDGRKLLLEINETPLKQNGRVSGLVGLARDISDQRRLLHLEKQFDSFLKTCPIPTIVYDLQGLMRECNPAFESLFGWSREELRGKTVDFVPEAERDATRAGIRKVLGGQVLNDFETRRLTRSGALLEISLTSFRLTDESGHPTGIIVMLRDVTARKTLERELRHRLAFEESLVQSSMDGIIAVDRQGLVIAFNQGAARIMGYTPEEVIGKIPVEKLYPPGKAREVKKALLSDRFGGPGKLIGYRTELLTQKGEVVPMRLSGSLLSEGGQEMGSVGFFHDLTIQKNMEEALLREKAITEELVDGSPIPTFVLDRNQQVVFWNRACVELTGVSRLEMVGSREIWKPFYPEERPVLANLI